VIKYTNGTTAAQIYGLAMCIVDGAIYRFSCDYNWDVKNDIDYPSIQEAMKAICPQYQNQSVHWNKFDDTDTDAIFSESKR
jgi:hypothetical protein